MSDSPGRERRAGAASHRLALMTHTVLRAVCRVAFLPFAGVLFVAATPVPDDERMILAHEAYVVTFDASTVVIDKNMRRARTHIYLPAPDPEGYVSFDASEQIDCKAGAYRYTDAVGHKANGDTAPMVAETPNLQPIVKDTPISVLRDHLCALADLRQGTYGVMLQVPGAEAARAVFRLLKVGLDAKPAAQLASQGYVDTEALTYNLDSVKVEPARRARVIEALGPLVAEEAKSPPPIVPLATAVASGQAGQYFHEEMELVAGVWLKVDGTFEYYLTVGSLDETARGRWTADHDRITLVPAARSRRTDIDPAGWQVMSDGSTLTIVREGQAMTFTRRKEAKGPNSGS